MAAPNSRIRALNPLLDQSNCSPIGESGLKYVVFETDSGLLQASRFVTPIRAPCQVLASLDWMPYAFLTTAGSCLSALVAFIIGKRERTRINSNFVFLSVVMSKQTAGASGIDGRAVVV